MSINSSIQLQSETPRVTKYLFNKMQKKRSTKSNKNLKPGQTANEIFTKAPASSPNQVKKQQAQKKKMETEQFKNFLQDLRATLQRAEEEREELSKKNLLLMAELQTLSRRSATAAIKARQDGIVDVVKHLTETLDNLERALASMEKDDNTSDAVFKGVRLTYTSLLDCLKNFDITPIDPQGQLFDPQYHEAMGRTKAENTAPNTVVRVMQKGYRMGDNRLIRPARVLVSQ